MKIYTTLLALVLAAGFSSAFVETAVASPGGEEQMEEEAEEKEEKEREDEEKEEEEEREKEEDE